MKVQSRLLGYFSGKPGDFMTPLLEVKFLEHSGPAGRKREVRRRDNTEDKGKGGGDPSEWLWLSDVFWVALCGRYWEALPPSWSIEWRRVYSPQTRDHLDGSSIHKRQHLGLSTLRYVALCLLFQSLMGTTSYFFITVYVWWICYSWNIWTVRVNISERPQSPESGSGE